MHLVYKHQPGKQHLELSVLLFSISLLTFSTAVFASHTRLIPSEALSNEPIQPLYSHEPLDPKKIKLGRSLFFNPRLSRDNSISCASCHHLKKGGTDNQRFSTGVGRVTGKINAPTVYNTHLNLAQFWDGRAHNLTEQVSGPVENPLEMASSWPEIIQKLSLDNNFIRQYQSIYNGELKARNLINSIAEFEKSLTTLNAPFDRYLASDNKAISQQAKKGYAIFKSYGCSACHQGANIGGNMYQKMGIMADYFSERGTAITETDLGRYNVTKDEYDKYTFKVPSLRLAVLTAPYFHDGSVKTLESAINKMAHYQLGREISSAEVQLVIAFLKTLVGKHKELTLPATE